MLRVWKNSGMVLRIFTALGLGAIFVVYTTGMYVRSFHHALAECVSMFCLRTDCCSAVENANQLLTDARSGPLSKTGRIASAQNVLENRFQTRQSCNVCCAAIVQCTD